MALPYFFTSAITAEELTLDEDNSRHIVQVLRMDTAEHILLTDGKGTSAEAEIILANKKHCTVHVINRVYHPRPARQLTIAISLIKNVSRFEWFLEKATELGTASIIPLICERTEKQKFRIDRFSNICKSAMLQSMQYWLPDLHEAQSFDDVIKQAAQQQKLIAHCVEDEKQELLLYAADSSFSRIILIGPEGDFTTDEIEAAKGSGFKPVSLGHTRLRTETAGMYAAVVLNS